MWDLWLPENLGTFLNHALTTGTIPANNKPEVLDHHEHNISYTESSLCDSIEYKQTTQTEHEHTTQTVCNLQGISQEVMQKSSALPTSNHVQ